MATMPRAPILRVSSAGIAGQPPPQRNVSQEFHAQVPQHGTGHVVQDRNEAGDKSGDEQATREREVIDHVAAGLQNKQIASGLGIVEKTVKVHRARDLAKLGIRSTAQLVRLVVENEYLRSASAI